MDMGKKNGLTQPCFEKMLDYTIDIFESNGLGTAYYGYHNIDHELEVTLGTLLVCGGEESIPELSKDDLKYLYVSALFHDFDPEKSVDKPHEENVLKSISLDPTIKDLIIKAGIDFEIIKVLILRTVYPWEGDLRERAEKEIEKCFQISEITKDNPEKQKHYLWLGWLLSIIDRVTGYALGDFSKALHLAKMNSHASAWNPALMIKRSVMYFEGLIGSESNMCEMVLRCLPKHMRKNFMQNVQEFMKLRQKEIQIQSDFLYDNPLDTMLYDGTFTLKEGNANMAIMGYLVAYHLGVRINDFEHPVYIYVPKRTGKTLGRLDNAFNIKPVYLSAVFAVQQEFDSKYVIISLDLARELLQYKNEVTDIEIRLDPSADMEQIQEKVKEIAGNRFIVKNRFQQQELLYRIMKSEKWAIFL
jgi:hypothetical protein